MALVLERCPLPEVNAVAEVGFGTGELLREVVARAAPALTVGIAPDRWMLAHATGFEARLGAAEDLPLGDEAFHLVCSSPVLDRVADRRRAVAELRRVLLPGGWAGLWRPVTFGPLDRYLPPPEPPERWMRALAGGGFPWVAAQQHVARRTTTPAALAREARRWLPTEELAPGLRWLEEDARRDPRRRISDSLAWCLIWCRK